jgi:hypothetical protein
MAMPPFGEGAQGRSPWWPGNDRSPWVLEEIPRRWGGTIPLVAQVAEGMTTGLTNGVRVRAPEVRISVGNPRGQKGILL